MNKKGKKDIIIDENTVMVKLVDWKKINKEVTESVLKDGVPQEDGSKKIYPSDVRFEVVDEFGLIDSPRIAIIDDECVGQTETEKYEFGFFLRKDNSNSFTMFPAFGISLSLDEIKKYLTGETKTLKDFMGDRYNYNSRLRGNLSSLLDYLRTGK